MAGLAGSSVSDAADLGFLHTRVCRIGAKSKKL